MGSLPEHEPVRLPESEGATATLDDVDIAAELWSRPRHASSYEAEDRAMAVLAREMTENPRNMLQKLVEVAVELCRADTAGISILEGDVFRWEAVAGVFASYRNDTMPRAASPCGITIDRNLTQLMHLPDRCFPALRTEPRFVEALLIPFHHRRVPVGTVWIVAHSEERKFDAEDERVVRMLAQFASAGWQLWKAYEAADESSRRKDRFLAMLGHELRNPLAAISSATSVLRRVGANDAAMQAQVLDMLSRQSAHLSRIVDDLLDVSRLSQDKLELRKTRVDLAKIVANAVETARAGIDRRRQHLAVDMPAAPIWLHADPVRLTQVVANLLDNAAKFTPESGRIHVTATATDGEATITVRDSGRGITPEHLRTIFDLFVQADEHRGEGLGLGLTLVRRLTEMHGGTVEAASEGPGKGAAFTVRLPLQPDALAPAAESGAVKAVAPRRILLVEDNVDVAETFAMTLSFEGHAVKIARDGASALEAAKTFMPDVVLLDVGLPGISGYDVARGIRETRVGHDLLIVAVSGYGQSDDRELTRQAGCDAHLVKPVDPEHLRAVLGRTTR